MLDVLTRERLLDVSTVVTLAPTLNADRSIQARDEKLPRSSLYSNNCPLSPNRIALVMVRTSAVGCIGAALQAR
jgi:hypothetical protein